MALILLMLDRISIPLVTFTTLLYKYHFNHAKIKNIKYEL